MIINCFSSLPLGAGKLKKINYSLLLIPDTHILLFRVDAYLAITGLGNVQVPSNISFPGKYNLTR